MKERYEFEEITLLSPFAVGAPGKRTFFLLVGQEGEWVRAWLEKEQLQSLGLAIDEFLHTLAREYPRLARQADGSKLSSDIPSGMPSAEVEIEEIALGYDEAGITLSFVVHVVGPEKLDHASLTCHTKLVQLKQFAKQANELYAAGRPRCALCGGPIDPEGHVCPRSN